MKFLKFILILILMLPALVLSAETLCYTEVITGQPTFNIYGGWDHPNNPIVWTHNVPPGILENVVRVGLYIEMYDIDYPADDEHDRVFFNGVDLGLLEGFNDTWVTVEKTVPVSAINVGVNHLSVSIDELHKGWKTKARRSELRFYCTDARPDFTIGVTPAGVETTPGATASYDVTLTGLNGFSSPVDLKVAGLPTGASGAFTVQPVTPSPLGNSTLNVTTSASTPAGEYTLTVTGKNGESEHSTQVTLTVKEEDKGDPDFTINATPSVRNIKQGESAAYDVKLLAKDGFSETVHLNVFRLPEGAQGSYNPMAVVPGPGGESTLTITTTENTPVGKYILTVHGTAGEKKRYTEVKLVIEAKPEPPKNPDFEVAVSPGALEIEAGDKAGLTVTLTPTDDFADDVELKLTGLPEGVDHAFTVNPANPTKAAQSIININTTTETTPGTYTLTITGTGGGKTHSAQAQLTIKEGEPPLEKDFTISPAPAKHTILRAQNCQYVLNIKGHNGFTDDVALTLSPLPAGITGELSAAKVTPDGTVQLNLATGADMAVGGYSITVTATGGGKTHEATLSLTVTCPSVPVSIDVEPKNGAAPLKVQLEGVVGVQPNYPVSQYTLKWDLGDGSEAAGERVEHIYHNAGVYTATLTVTDPCGKTITAQQTIEVDSFKGNITKTFTKTTAMPGEEVMMKIQVTNPGTVSFNNIVIRDELADTLIYVSDDAPAAPAVNGKEYKWTLPTLGAGQTAVLNVTLKVSDTAQSGTVSNIAYMTHGSLAAETASAPALLTVQTVDVILRKQVDKTTAKPGDTLRYHITLKNRSAVALTGIVLEDELPEQLELIATEGSGGLDDAHRGSRLKWRGNLEAGADAVLIVNTRVKQDTFSGTSVRNTAEVTADQMREKLNSDTVETRVEADPVSSAQVRLNLRAEVPQTEVGRVIRFNVTIGNHADSNLLSPVVEIQLPQGFAYVAGSTLLDGQAFADPQGRGLLVWQLPHLNGNSTHVIRYQVVIGADAARGRNMNKAALRAVDNSGQDIFLEDSAFVNVSSSGFVFYSGVEGTVYLDRDFDGFYSMSDKPLEGIEVRMSTGEKAYTDILGRYAFQNLFPGEYAVAVNTATLPDQYRAAEMVPQVVVLADGLTDHADFGIKFKNEKDDEGRLEGRVFYDKNRNGIYDGDDTLAEVFTAHLDGDQAVTKGEKGKFVFSNLKVGKHTVEVRYGPRKLIKEIDLKRGKNVVDCPLFFSGIRIIIEGVGK